MSAYLLLALAVFAAANLSVLAHVPYFEPEAFWIRDPKELPSQVSRSRACETAALAACRQL